METIFEFEFTSQEDYIFKLETSVKSLNNVKNGKKHAVINMFNQNSFEGTFKYCVEIN